MAYNYPNPQSPVQQSNPWGQPTPPISPYSNGQPYPAAPTPTIDAAALNSQLQPAYQSPQFAPPPPPPPKAGNGSVLKAFNFFSTKPSYIPQVNTGESSLSSPTHNSYIAPGQQQYGTVSIQPTGTPQPSPLTPLPYNQTHTPAPLSPGHPYNPQALAGQPGSVPVYQNPGTASPAPLQQQQQPHQQQNQQPQYQQPQQPQPHQQYQPHQQPHQQFQQPQQPQPEKPHQQPQPQQPQPHYQQPIQNTSHSPSQASGAPPPAYVPNPSVSVWPEKPTMQSVQATAPVAPAAPTPAPNHQASHQVNAQQGQGAIDNTKYWTALVQEGKIPLAPKAQLRSLFRGIAACINKECTLDKTPQCVLSPAKMSMYYGMQSGYNSRESQLFSRAQTAPSTLLTLYARLEVEHVLIPSNPGDGKRKPHSPALTVTGFEHWLLLNVLLNPEAEYQRILKFISAAGRQIIDDQGHSIPANGFPREALPQGPDAFVVKRYGGYMEEALASTGKVAREEELAEEEGLRKEIETLKKRLFENKGEMEKRDSELKKRDDELRKSNSELEKSNAELGRVTQMLAKATASADQAVTKVSASWGVVLPEDRKPQQQPQSPYSPYTPNPQQQQQHQQQYQHPSDQQRRQSEQGWPQPQQEQYPPQQYPPQQQRQQLEQQRPQMPGQNQQPQQQSYYRQQYQPAR